jgi:hypothetical protein
MRIALIVVFVLYGLPLWKLRYRWRATVYRVDGWKINVLPWFGHDIAALFTNRYFVTDGERRMARQFRWYMAGYMTLLTLIVGLP